MKKIIPRMILPLLLLTSLQVHAFPKLRSTLQPGHAEGNSFRIGPSYGRYFYHLSGPEIYMYRVNNGFEEGTARILEVSDKFGSVNDFGGFSVIYEMEAYDKGLLMEIGWSMRRKSTDARYTYDYGPNTPVIDHYEKVKLSSNMLFFSLGYRPIRVPALMMSFGMDMGFLRTKKKVIDETDATSGKWMPWFYSVKIFDSGKVTAKTPIACSSFALSYDFSAFTLRLSHTMPILDGELLSQTGKYTNIPWSSKVFPMRHTMISLMYNFNHN
jgi:hypothetical protein